MRSLQRLLFTVYFYYRLSNNAFSHYSGGELNDHKNFGSEFQTAVLSYNKSTSILTITVARHRSSVQNPVWYSSWHNITTTTYCIYLE